MIDTTDLTSYYSGYDDYCEPKEEKEYDDRDNYEDYVLEKEKIMDRNIIDLSNTNLTLEEVIQLEDYVWKADKLIPIELLDGE